MMWFQKRRFIRREHCGYSVGSGTYYRPIMYFLPGAIVLTSILSVPFLLWNFGIILWGSAILAFLVLFLLFIVVPIIFRYTYVLQRSMVFLNFVKWPPNPQFSTPEKYGLKDTRNFYVTTDEDIKLGVWHVLPASLSNSSLASDTLLYEQALSNGEPIVLYMHGNSASRASSHRVELYQVLQKLNYHVVAFDYRSYADSSPVVPTETGVVADGVFMFKWVAERAKTTPIFVWGHSLGTGVSSHALALLASNNVQCKGLVLEAPFNNLRDEIIEHPFSRFFSFLPWFEFCFVDPVGDNQLLFETDKHLAQFQSPVLILHAQDDLVVPFALGKRLYNTVLKLRSGDGDGTVEFVSFEKTLKLGHKYICRSPKLPDVVRQFVSKFIKH